MRSCHQQDDYMKVIQYIKTLVLLDKTRHIFLSNKPIYVEIGWFWNLGPLVSLLTELPIIVCHHMAVSALSYHTALFLSVIICGSKRTQLPHCSILVCHHMWQQAHSAATLLYSCLSSYVAASALSCHTALFLTKLDTAQYKNIPFWGYQRFGSVIMGQHYRSINTGKHSLTVYAFFAWASDLSEDNLIHEWSEDNVPEVHWRKQTDFVSITTGYLCSSIL